MPRKIVITAGGDPGASDLTNCYFLPTNSRGRYILFDPDGRPILTDPMPVSSGEIFTFHHKSFHWTVSSFTLNDEYGSGGWSNNDNAPRITDVEGGTFTAQATGGGGAEEDEGRASTATA